MTPDAIDPIIGIPLAVILWAWLIITTVREAKR